MLFPKKFVWGAAASSYQIEGATFEDNKGLSIWDHFCRQPGKIFNGDTGETACNHYHCYKDDIKLMADIGIKAYRFSISWPRVLPEGKGTINEKGLDFYDKLVDTLLEYDIKPWATLYHWDFPYNLYCQGGWLNRDSSDWFAEYVSVIVDKLSDRVSKWMTLNEPQIFIQYGYDKGAHAPGVKMGWSDILRIWHNCLLAHGKAVLAIRDKSVQKPSIGAASCGLVTIPFSETPEDIEAARKAMFGEHLINNRTVTWFADPLIFGKYPQEETESYGSQMPEIQASDMDIISQPLDFFGMNIYKGKYYRANQDGGYESVDVPGHDFTAFNWAVTPKALYWGPKFLFERYNLPIVITENGMANDDHVENDGKVHDSKRINFHEQYLREYCRSAKDGVNIEGYFLWSIMDNFEWAEGYSKRFGIIYIDYESQKRILKDSAGWYKNVIANNGFVR